MHRFPQGEKNKLVRQHWIANLQRKDFNPGSSARVCSVHFIDARPSKDNPYPTLHLGTPTAHHKGRRKLVQHDVKPLEPETCSTAEPLSHHLSDEQDEESAAADDHLPINIQQILQQILCIVEGWFAICVRHFNHVVVDN
ncbi:uncharacterized protein LOC144094545 [Amblyomma americanum]